MPEDEDEPVIAYSVRELLAEMRAEMRANFRNLFDRLDGKADKRDVDDLTRRVDGMDGRLKDVESASVQRQGKSTWWSEWRRWVVPTVLSAVMTAAMVYSILQGTGGGGAAHG